MGHFFITLWFVPRDSDPSSELSALSFRALWLHQTRLFLWGSWGCTADSLEHVAKLTASRYYRISFSPILIASSTKYKGGLAVTTTRMWWVRGVNACLINLQYQVFSQLFAEGMVADPFTLIPAVMGASITATTPFHSPFLTAVKVRKATAAFFVIGVDTQTIHKH